MNGMGEMRVSGVAKRRRAKMGKMREMVKKTKKTTKGKDDKRRMRVRGNGKKWGERYASQRRVDGVVGGRGREVKGKWKVG